MKAVSPLQIRTMTVYTPPQPHKNDDDGVYLSQVQYWYIINSDPDRVSFNDWYNNQQNVKPNQKNAYIIMLLCDEENMGIFSRSRICIKNIVMPERYLCSRQRIILYRIQNEKLWN